MHTASRKSVAASMHILQNSSFIFILLLKIKRYTISAIDTTSIKGEHYYRQQGETLDLSHLEEIFT
jgi:hypothetical protein